MQALSSTQVTSSLTSVLQHTKMPEFLHDTESRSPDPKIMIFFYLFFGILFIVGITSAVSICLHQRRLNEYLIRDNANNNMQRQSLVDSFIQDGEVEWQCSVCYYENHPAKKECLMCGTISGISLQSIPTSPERQGSKAHFSSLQTDVQAARKRAFNTRIVNESRLNQRQRGARRRNLWQREKTEDGKYRWVRIDDCRPTARNIPSGRRILSESGVPRGRQRNMFASIRLSGSNTTNTSMNEITASLYQNTGRGYYTSQVSGLSNAANQSELSTQWHQSVPSDAYIGSTLMDNEIESYSAPSRSRLIQSLSERLQSAHQLTSKFLSNKQPDQYSSPRGSYSSILSPAASISSITSGGSIETTLLAQKSVGYVRNVDENGVIRWVPADTIVNHHVINVQEFPRSSTYIDLESIAALPFRRKVRWFLAEIEKVALPWEEGHLLLKIRRDSVLQESMHLLMLVPARDMRQRLRIEFIQEPGLDAGGLLREWVLLLCKELFSDSFGLFQSTHIENLGYWINPNSKLSHANHLQYYQFIGRLIAKCLLEGQLLIVHFALPFLKHLLGVPISFSDLEFLDQELYNNASWLRTHSNVEDICLDFSVQVIDENGERKVHELKPGGSDILVTDTNKEEYLALLVQYKMFDSVQEQLTAILEGLYGVIPRTLVAAFDYQELELLLCGMPNIDVDDWEKHTDIKYIRFDAPTKHEKLVIQWFWELLRCFSQEYRARLLQFVTGTSRVPVEGFKALLSNDGRVRRFGIQLVPHGIPPTGLFPKAHTCFNRIDLPLYNSKETLEKYLTLVMNMEITGFSMQ